MQKIPLTSASPFRGKLILVVDDNEINLKLARAVLSHFGFEAVTVPNGMAALERYNPEVFGLILMDLNMPELDGFETVKRIREIEKNKSAERCPIFAFTAHAGESDRSRCRKVGIDDVIAKPCSGNDLVRKIQDWISRGVQR